MVSKLFSTTIYTLKHLQASCRSPPSPNTSLVFPGLTPNYQPVNQINFHNSLHSQVSPGKLSESSKSKHLSCVSRTSSQPSTCRDVLKHFKSNYVVSDRHFDKSLSSHDLTAKSCHKLENKAHCKTNHLDQKFSSSSMPLTLHQQCTNLAITVEPQYKLNTYPCRRSRSSIPMISASP